MVTTRAAFWSGTTARARRFKSPLREFLRTESGGAAVLLAATAAALVWANVDTSSYEELWESVLAIDVGGGGVELTLREWVNSGLMTFFFFVLEPWKARRSSAAPRVHTACVSSAPRPAGEERVRAPRAFRAEIGRARAGSAPACRA